MKKLLATFLIAFVAAVTGYCVGPYAQTIIAPVVAALNGAGFTSTTVSTTVTANASLNPDLVNVIPHGVPSAQSQYGQAYLISGQAAYLNLGVATTGNTYVFAHGLVYMFMQPSGTLGAVTLTTEASPQDGQRECFVSSQTTSTLTWNVASGQTMNPTITAGVANTGICIIYSASNSTWYRT